jgi:hypothetical protein|tara:strand:+ start:342 stop:536 length:195 start_codon:yes stop_codon:yes gene_type:complete
MWLLLFIYFNNGQFDKTEIVHIYHTEKECKDRGNYAATIGIPEGLVLTCIKLNGVTKANAKKLH